jgi:hypothetical protein
MTSLAGLPIYLDLASAMEIIVIGLDIPDELVYRPGVCKGE